MQANRSKEQALTADCLREMLSYDPETGDFVWLLDRGPKISAGELAGNTSHAAGYRTIRVNYHKYLAHRLAWLYVYGEWPKDEVDHINGETDDNRLCNLRLATRQQQLWNSAPRSNNKFGMRNIRPKGKKFHVHFSRKNKRIYHKSQPTLEAALIDRDRVAAMLHGEYSSANR